jgi:hypothetical protein
LCYKGFRASSSLGGIFEEQVGGVDDLQLLDRRADDRAVTDGIDDPGDAVGVAMNLRLGGVGEQRVVRNRFAMDSEMSSSPSRKAFARSILLL